MRALARFLATTAYTGFSPVAPGTVGALVVLLLLLVFGSPGVAGLILWSAVVFAVGVWASGLAERDYGHDAGKINIDEDVGMLIAALGASGEVAALILAFLLFRLFDVVKPFPADAAQSLPGGWGVMVDDVVAGVYAAVATAVVRWLVAAVF